MVDITYYIVWSNVYTMIFNIHVVCYCIVYTQYVVEYEDLYSKKYFKIYEVKFVREFQSKIRKCNKILAQF